MDRQTIPGKRTFCDLFGEFVSERTYRRHSDLKLLNQELRMKVLCVKTKELSWISEKKSRTMNSKCQVTTMYCFFICEA